MCFFANRAQERVAKKSMFLTAVVPPTVNIVDLVVPRREEGSWRVRRRGGGEGEGETLEGRKGGERNGSDLFNLF